MNTTDPDYVIKMRQQAAALEAFDKGVPSTLPEDNRFKRAVENHRWGMHREGAARPSTCPVCARA